MIKSQSKGRIPVLKNGAEGEKPKSEASTSKSPSVRPKLFGGKKTDKSKDVEKAKSKSEKSKVKDEKTKDREKMEEIRRQKVEEAKEKERQKKLKKEKEKVKEKSEKEKKKFFKPSERTQSKLGSKSKSKISQPVSPPPQPARSGIPRSPEATVKLHYVPEEDSRLKEDVAIGGVYYPDSPQSPSEPQYDIVGSPIRKGDNFLLKYQIKGDYLERQEANQGSSSSSETQPTPDSVQSFNELRLEKSETSDTSESKGDYSSQDKSKSDNSVPTSPEIYSDSSCTSPKKEITISENAVSSVNSSPKKETASEVGSPKRATGEVKSDYSDVIGSPKKEISYSPKHSDHSADYSESTDKGSGGYPSPKRRPEKGDYYSDNSSRSSSSGNPSPKRVVRYRGYQGENSSGESQVYEVVQHIPTYQPVEVMSDDPEQKYDVRYGECPRSPSARSDPGVLEDTPAKPHRIRYGPGRRQVPRRHTLGADLMTGSDYEDPEDKRAAFMDLLANRYPAYADKIYSGTGTQSEIAYPLKTSRQRDPRRRQTTIVTYHPNRSVEYDDSGAMSDIDVPTGFTRGGFQRSSLPIVRTPSLSLDRTLGLAFLVYGNETKKCLLPNEITTLDTVRALFVHHFPEKLTFDFLESPRQKIYILDPKTNIFFQLDDLSEIRDRTVLRIHECDSDKPQKLKDQPKIRGRAISAPPPRHYEPRHADTIPQRSRDDAAMQPYHTYMIDGDPRTQWEVERRSRSRSRTPEPERPKSLPGRSRYSPERQHTPERGLLGTIPEHRQMQNGRPSQNGHYEPVYYQRNQPQSTSPTRAGRPFSPTTTSYENPYYGYHGPPSSEYYPKHNGGEPNYVQKPKRQPANVPPQYAMVPPHPDMRNAPPRHPSTNRHSLAFAPMTTGRPPPPAENYYQQPPPRHRPISDEDGFSQPRSATPIPEYYSKKRIDKMEEQLANLAAWVHKSATDSLGRRSGRSIASSNASESSETLPISSASKINHHNPVLFSDSVKLRLDYPGLSGLSDSSSQRTLVTCSKEMKLSMIAIREKTCNLRLELRGLRRAQQLNYEDICEAIANTLHRIKRVLQSRPGADCQLIRQQRYETDGQVTHYMMDQKRLDNELGDLEHSVEELRNDVVTRQCRVQMSDIEAMALLLSNITKAIADLKTRFPCLQEKMKSVMSGEMEVVVKEEKFLKEEPDRIDASLKRCKKLTGTLYTLKRLASVQDHRPLNVPAVASKSSEPTNDDKYGVLENIRAIVPNHTTRLSSLEEAESSRERKKKIIKQQESLKFGKSLELAQKSLKPAENDKPKSDAIVSLSGYKINNASQPHVATTTQGHSIVVSSKVLPAFSQGATLPPPPPTNQAVVTTATTIAADKPQSIPLSTMSIPASPTATANPEVKELNNQKQAARAAFFSSLSSPETSPNGPISPKKQDSAPPHTTMDYVVKFSPAQISSINSSTSEPMTTTSSGTIFSTQYSSSAPSTLKSPLSPTTKSSSIPRPSGKISPSQDHGDVVKGKKPPPPPPPRKSSRLPLGSHLNGTVSPVRAFSPDGQVTDIKSSNGEGKHPVVYSSTPKPIPAKKPQSKYQKDIVAGIYANMNRPDLQCQKTPPDQEMPSKAETKTNVVLDREGSSDSTSSSASLDSQLGTVMMRDSDMISSTGSSGSDTSIGKKKKPRPNPPERRSSLLSKSPTRDPKTQLLQDQTNVLNQLQQQQTALLQRHNDLVKSTNNPPPTLPKPTSPTSSQNGKK